MSTLDHSISDAFDSVFLQFTKQAKVSVVSERKATEAWEKIATHCKLDGSNMDQVEQLRQAVFIFLGRKIPELRGFSMDVAPLASVQRLLQLWFQHTKTDRDDKESMPQVVSAILVARKLNQSQAREQSPAALAPLPPRQSQSDEPTSEATALREYIENMQRVHQAEVRKLMLNQERMHQDFMAELAKRDNVTRDQSDLVQQLMTAMEGDNRNDAPPTSTAQPTVEALRELLDARGEQDSQDTAQTTLNALRELLGVKGEQEARDAKVLVRNLGKQLALEAKEKTKRVFDDLPEDDDPLVLEEEVLLTPEQWMKRRIGKDKIYEAFKQRYHSVKFGRWAQSSAQKSTCRNVSMELRGLLKNTIPEAIDTVFRDFSDFASNGTTSSQQRYMRAVKSFDTKCKEWERKLMVITDGLDAANKFEQRVASTSTIAPTWHKAMAATKANFRNASSKYGASGNQGASVEDEETL